MAMSIEFLGHSGFVLDDGSGDASGSIAIDPFLTGNPVAVRKPFDLTVGHVAVTHGHADHLGDTGTIARSNGAVVYGAFEICEFLRGQGVERVEGMNPGGRISTGFGSVSLTQAFHSSSHEGVYMGMPCGVVVELGGVTLYHLGDTGLFGDLALLGEVYKPDVVCVPVGDRFTMGPELGARAAELVGAPVAIPIHWGTFPMLAQDISGFAPKGVEVRAMRPGETIEVG